MRRQRVVADLLDERGEVVAEHVLVLLEADGDTWWGRLRPDVDTPALPSEGMIRLEAGPVAPIRFTGDLGDDNIVQIEAMDIDLVGTGPPPF